MLTSVSIPQRLRLGPYIPLGDALRLEEWSLHQVAAAVYQPPRSRRAANCTHLRFCHPGWVQQAAHSLGGSCTWGGGCLVLPPWGLPQGLSRDLVAQSHPPSSRCRVPSAGFGGSGWVAWLQGLQPPGVSAEPSLGVTSRFPSVVCGWPVHSGHGGPRLRGALAQGNFAPVARPFQLMGSE